MSKKRNPSPIVEIATSELKKQWRLSALVLVACIVSSVVMFCFVPFIMSRYFEQLGSKTPDQHVLVQTAWYLAGATVVHGLCTFGKFRWRRQLTYIGRHNLSARVSNAISSANADSVLTRAQPKEEAQRLQDAWLTQLHATTEQTLPFVLGTTSFVALAVIQTPLLLILVVPFVTVATIIASVSAQKFMSYEKRLSEQYKRENQAFSAMIEVVSMKWLVDRLAALRNKASLGWSDVFRRQAKANAGLQALLLTLGMALHLCTVVFGPMLVSSGVFTAGQAIMLTLLGSMLGERFTMITFSIHNAMQSFEQGAVISAYIRDVEQQAPKPKVSAALPMVYELRGAQGVYGDRRVALPNVRLTPGITVVRGPSGCGKSTLLNVLGQSTPYVGRIVVARSELRNVDVSARVVNGAQSFGEVSLSVADLFGDNLDEKLLVLALECAAFPELSLEANLQELSGGQRRRAILAAIIYEALVRASDGVLLIDEPTNDLGRPEIKRVLRGFRTVRELCPWLVIVITTHEPKFSKIANRQITYLSNGTFRVMDVTRS